ncbi:MAG: (Fe-S)-binding protein, partial [Dehalococcoidia bacterium]|nr:(Fe-S)-binding protein [Dehalococcoidia bacterium]
FPKGATLPRPASTPFHRSRPSQAPHAGCVALYTGCMMDLVQPDMARAVVRALDRRGVGVVYPEQELCCGGPAIFSGDREAGLEMARRNLSSLEKVDADKIVTACPSCCLVLKREYPRLFAGEPGWRDRAEALASRVVDFASYAVGLDAPDGSAKAPHLKVTYHDSCHLKRFLGVSGEPRQLIRDAGYELIEMEDADRCCGYGGSYSLEQPEIAGAILDQKLDAIEATGAQVVACDCPGCLLHIASGLRKRGSAVRALHTAQLLE